MTNKLIVKKKIGSFNKKIFVSGDKSLSIRWVLFSSIASGVSTAKNLLTSEDVMAAIQAVRKLGIKVILKGQTCRIYGKGFNGYKFKKNIIIDSKNSGMLNLKAHLAFEVGDLDEAEKDARESLLGNPKSIPPWLLIARIQILKGSHSEALNALNNAEQINPKNPNINDLKGQILFNEGAYTEGLMLSQKFFTKPSVTKTEEDWTNLAESLLLELENLNLLEEPI